MSSHPLHLPLFFEYSWPPVSLTDREQAELISKYENGKSNFGFENIQEIPADGPRIELKAQTLGEAEGEAARYWRKRTGLTPSDCAPIGYAVIHFYGWCRIAHRLSDDGKTFV